MATNSRVVKKESVISNKYQGREILHDRSKVLTQKGDAEAGDEHEHQMKVSVVYYLSRNGQLEHPHFIEVPLSSSQGLFLKDVISRLNSLRGEGMAEMYSWSSKRSYRNGYVWQDLTGKDMIHPCHGHEYILKGSPLLETSLSFRSHESASSATPSSSSSSSSSSSMLSSISSDTTNGSGRYRARTTSGELGSFRAIHVSTQTDDDNDDDVKVRKRALGGSERREAEPEEQVIGGGRVSQTEVEEERVVAASRSSVDIRDRAAENERPSGRFKAAAVLMQLISCGSLRYPA